MIANLPEKFTRLMLESHGASGAQWLADLPFIIEEIERDWSLEIVAPFANLSYHFVAPCALKNGGEAVLKIGFPETNSPLFNEAATLELYDGRGAVRFLRINEKRFALLLERVNLGKNLKEVFRGREENSVEIAVEVLRKIIRKPPKNHEFLFLEKWFAGFAKARNTNFPAKKIERAGTFYEELSVAETFLIHGDFHHENILSAESEDFLAIDPKGIVGQIGYEISVFLNNHVWILAKDENLRKHLDFAVGKFSEAFAIAPTDLRRWAYAQAVLSSWWTFEENGANWKTDLELAEIWRV